MSNTQQDSNSISQQHQHEKHQFDLPDPQNEVHISKYDRYINHNLPHLNNHSIKLHLSNFFKPRKFKDRHGKEKTYVPSPTNDWLRQQYHKGFINNKVLVRQYNQWRTTPFAIELIDKITGDKIKIKQVKRGTEQFRKRTYARLYKACSEWILCHPTYNYPTDEIVQYKKIRRKVYMNNIMIITLTYKQKLTSKHRAYLWKNIMKDFNRWWTGVKQKIPIKYYIGATEGHKSGNPHLHLIVKLVKPLKTIKIGKYYRFLIKKAIESSWKQYGNVDIKAVSYNTHNPLGYIAKYIVKKVENPIELQQLTLTDAHKWINRKHTFTHTRNKSLKAWTNSKECFNLLFNLDLPLKKSTNYQVESYDYNGTIIHVKRDKWVPISIERMKAISYLGYIRQRIEIREIERYAHLSIRYIQQLLAWSKRIKKK